VGSEMCIRDRRGTSRPEPPKRKKLNKILLLFLFAEIEQLV